MRSMTPDLERIGDIRNALGETPVWSVAENALYWINVEHDATKRINSVTHDIADFISGLSHCPVQPYSSSCTRLSLVKLSSARWQS